MSAATGGLWWPAALLPEHLLWEYRCRLPGAHFSAWRLMPFWPYLRSTEGTPQMVPKIQLHKVGCAMDPTWAAPTLPGCWDPQGSFLLFSVCCFVAFISKCQESRFAWEMTACGCNQSALRCLWLTT